MPKPVGTWIKIQVAAATQHNSKQTMQLHGSLLQNCREWSGRFPTFHSKYAQSHELLFQKQSWSNLLCIACTATGSSNCNPFICIWNFVEALCVAIRWKANRVFDFPIRKSTGARQRTQRQQRESLATTYLSACRCELGWKLTLLDASRALHAHTIVIHELVVSGRAAVCQSVTKDRQFWGKTTWSRSNRYHNIVSDTTCYHTLKSLWLSVNSMTQLPALDHFNSRLMYCSFAVHVGGRSTLQLIWMHWTMDSNWLNVLLSKS